MQLQQNVFLAADKPSETAVYASSAVPKIFVKRSKPFMDEGNWHTLPRKTATFLTRLSADTVAERVSSLAEDIQCQLKEKY